MVRDYNWVFLLTSPIIPTGEQCIVSIKKKRVKIIITTVSKRFHSWSNSFLLAAHQVGAGLSTHPRIQTFHRRTVCESLSQLLPGAQRDMFKNVNFWVLAMQ